MATEEIKSIRPPYKMSRQVFARYLHISCRTLKNREQGRSKPNEQAVTLLHLEKSIQYTHLSRFAALPGQFTDKKTQNRRQCD